MLMDIELFTKINEVIADLQQQFYEASLVPLDMVVVEDDKYHNTEYETITYGLGVSQGLKTKKYFFNAIKDDNAEVYKYIEQPVAYYENCGDRCMVYRVTVDTMSRVIKIYEIRYAWQDVQYHLINTISLGKGKFAKKILNEV